MGQSRHCIRGCLRYGIGASSRETWRARTLHPSPSLVGSAQALPADADLDRGRNTQPRYNIAPTQQVLFVHHDGEGNQALNEGR